MSKPGSRLNPIQLEKIPAPLSSIGIGLARSVYSVNAMTHDAAAVPAWRAARVDPIVALRNE